MITLHVETGHGGYTYRQGNHIGRIFKAETKGEFIDALNTFLTDMGNTPYKQTDKITCLSEQTKSFIDRQ